jgi:hypothetical protein
MSPWRRFSRYAGVFGAALCVLAGVASFVSMSQAIGKAVGTAYYTAPPPIED